MCEGTTTKVEGRGGIAQLKSLLQNLVAQLPSELERQPSHGTIVFSVKDTARRAHRMFAVLCDQSRAAYFSDVDKLERN